MHEWSLAMQVRCLRSLLLVAFLLVYPISFAQSASAQSSQDSLVPARITAPIDESSLVTLPGNVHPLALTGLDNGPAPVSMPANRLLLVLSRSMQQEADLQTYLQSIQDRNSPNYRKFLSPSEFGKRFGISDADLQTVQTWLTGHGFSVTRVTNGRSAIEFSGTVGQVQTAFHTSVHSYTANDLQFWASATDPRIPSALAPVVAGIASMNSLKPKAQFIRGPSGKYDAQTHTITPTYTIGNTTAGYYIFLGPADAATIYDTPTTLNANRSIAGYDGSGVTIGIAGDSNIDITQNANYRATFGLPAKATSVVIDGADPGENGDAVEAYLDTQVSGGIAPNANVILYTAANTTYQSGLFLAIARAIDDNQADILNVSFSGCEAAFGTAGNQLMNSLWEQAAAQGITVTVSTGDSGSAGCDNPNTQTTALNGLAVNGIASTPYNIAVGGTDYDILFSNFPTSFSTYIDTTNTLPNHRSALKYIPEEPWNDSTYPNTTILQNFPISVASHYESPDDIIAGGGGVSTVFPEPNWQTGFGSSSGRSLPDVSLLSGNGFYGAIWGICTDQDYDAQTSSFLADCAGNPSTGNSFNLTGVGGTSAAAPAFAGMLALVEQKVGSRLGQADYVLYHLANTTYSLVFHDVVTGDNSVLCQSGSPNCEAVNVVNTYYLSGYNAATGYDEASGLGSVDAGQMTNFWASVGFTATTSSLQLNGAATALNITHGQSVAVSDAVSGSSGTPSGNIALVDNLSPASQPNLEGIATFPLSSGAASGTTTALPGGTYQVTAHYGGDSTFAQSVSNAIPVTVAPESSSTTVKVAGYYDPSTGKAATTPYYGFIYLIDAQPYGNSASSANPNGAATGTVTFKAGTATLGTAPLSSQGVAELQNSTLPGGTDSITAAFPGDPSFQASTSAAVSFSVTPAPSVLNLTSDQTFYNVGDPAAITATFASSASSKNLDSLGVAPTGTVTFFDGTNPIGTASVTGTAGTAASFATGSATYTTNRLASGERMVTATYSGDSNYAPSSTSAPFGISVDNATTPMTVVPATSSVNIDQPLLVTATLPASGTLPAPTGTVVFSAVQLNGNTLGQVSPVQITNGTATFTFPANFLIIGPLNIYAFYTGDQYYAGVLALAPIQVHSSGTVSPTVKLTLPSAPIGSAFPVTVTISGPSGDPVPTGSVTIVGSSLTWPLVNGSASFTVSVPMPPGPNTVTLTYSGDTTYATTVFSGTVTRLGNTSISISPFNPTINTGQPLNLAVTVMGVTELPAPTGTITLSSGSYSSAAVALSAGATNFTIPANTLPVGSDAVTANYSGDINYPPDSDTDYVNVTTVPVGINLTASTVTITAGATTNNTSTITVTPQGGFTGSVTLSAAITAAPTSAQNYPSLSLGSTSPVNVTGPAATATLTITTTAPTSAALSPPKFFKDRWSIAAGFSLACLLLFGIPARRRAWRKMLGALALFLILLGGVSSCGGGGSSGGGGGGSGKSGTTTGTYTITVTGTSGSVSGSGTVILVVQ